MSAIHKVIKDQSLAVLHEDVKSLEYPDGKIKNKVSVIYYPGQKMAKGILVGHAELEVEGRCYCLGLKQQMETSLLEKKIQRANEGGGLPFKQIKFWVTAKQFSEIKVILSSMTTPVSSKYFDWVDIDGSQVKIEPERYLANRKVRGITCMDGIGCVLREADVVHIPIPCRLSPLHSYVFLSGAHAVHCTQVDEVLSYGNAIGNLKNIFGVTRGVGGEFFFTLVIVMFLINTFQTFSGLLIDNFK